jgi:hypothetical protein
MTLIELKAAAYDALAQIEFFQRTLAELNGQISELTQNEMRNPRNGDLPKDEPPTVPPVKPKE